MNAPEPVCFVMGSWFHARPSTGRLPQAAIPVLVSLLSHGTLAFALSSVGSDPLRPAVEASTIEFVAVAEDPLGPKEPEAAAASQSRRFPPPNRVAAIRPNVPQEVPPRETTPGTEAAAGERPPTNYEDGAQLSDILVGSGTSGASSIALVTPEATAGATPWMDDDAPGRGRDDTRPPTLEEREAEIEAELAARLQREGNARHYLTHRPPPELARRQDGSYTFSGPRFTAVIEADGTVRFSDRSNVNVAGSGTDFGPGLSGTFDIMDAMQEDPMRAERRWFLRETRELRQQLEGDAQKRAQDTAVNRLEGQLRALWRGAGDGASKRARILRIWREVASDEVGIRARRAIEGFVRRNLPAGSSDAFTDEELAAFNRGRSARDRFRPYS